MDKDERTKQLKERRLTHLNAVIKLLQKKERWTSGAEAQDENGFSVGWNNKRAQSFCLLGAINRTASQLRKEGQVPNSDDIKALIAATAIVFRPARYLWEGPRNKPTKVIERFNDDRYTRHNDVMTVLKDLRTKVRKGI